MPAGATASRADYTGQFSNAGGGSAFIQTVFDFDSLANGSVSGGDFIAYDGSAPLVRLAASGQLRSLRRRATTPTCTPASPWPATRFVDHHDGTGGQRHH